MPDGSVADSIVVLSSSVTEDDSDFKLVEWPEFAQINYNGHGKVNLTNQQVETRLVLRQAIKIVEGRIMFENSFPDITEHMVWKHKALLEATSYVMNMLNTAA